MDTAIARFMEDRPPILDYSTPPKPDPNRPSAMKRVVATLMIVPAFAIGAAGILSGGDRLYEKYYDDVFSWIALSFGFFMIYGSYKMFRTAMGRN